MIDDSVKKAIEQAWLDRAKAQYLKPGTAKYRTMEVEFFTGAMATLNALFPHEDRDRLSNSVPVSWVVRAMSGQPIVEAAK